MKKIAIDIETEKSLDPWEKKFVLISMYEPGGGKILYDPNKIKVLLEDRSICKVIHNAEFDATYLAIQFGITIRNIWDTRLCEQVILGIAMERGIKDNTYSSSLQYTLPRYGMPVLNKTLSTSFKVGVKLTGLQENYALDDVRYLLPLQELQEQLLIRDGLLEVAMLENKCVEKTIAMRTMGIGIDVIGWKRKAEINKRQYETLIASLPKSVSNWNSPAQVKAYFATRGLYIESLSDIPEFDDTHLKTFIAARNLYKNATTYGHSWIEPIKPDGRIHCNFTQIVDSGRYSSSKPNMQNVPIGHREFFIPAKGNVFIVGDFTGQELGIMAAAAKETLWINAMLRGEDIHSVTAKAMYGSVWDAATVKSCTYPFKCKCPGHMIIRDTAKTLNFMLAYGGGHQTFAKRTGITENDAKKIVIKYKRVVRKLTRWLEKNGIESKRTRISYSADPYKRFRRLLKSEEWQTENQGKNNPVQSAGANCLKLAMVSLNLPIVLVIHDEIICEVPKAKANAAVKEMKQVMEKAAAYITGIHGLIKVEPKIQKNICK